eukprot:1766151-Rhodomonas_salina.1
MLRSEFDGTAASKALPKSAAELARAPANLRRPSVRLAKNSVPRASRADSRVAVSGQSVYASRCSSAPSYGFRCSLLNCAICVVIDCFSVNPSTPCSARPGVMKLCIVTFAFVSMVRGSGFSSAAMRAS